MLYEAARRCRAPPGGKGYPSTRVKEKHLDTHEAAVALAEYTFKIDGMTCAVVTNPLRLPRRQPLKSESGELS
jgi:hypothetical protein